jgi:hypothetical protein
MSGFVSSPPVATVVEAAIQHDGFFPGIRLSDVRDRARIPSQATDARLRDAIVSSMLTISTELADWKVEQIGAGHATLDTVSSDAVAGVPRLVRLYERAIVSFVAAELADTHHDISASADGKNRAEERALASDEHRRNGTHAIRDMLNVTRREGAARVTRTAVELI